MAYNSYDSLPRIDKQNLVETKSRSTHLTFLEDSGVEVGDILRDHGNERRSSPTTVAALWRSGNQSSQKSSSRTSSPVQKRPEPPLADETSYRESGSRFRDETSHGSGRFQRLVETGDGLPSSSRSFATSLDLTASLDEPQVLRDKLTRVLQDRDHLNVQVSHYRQAAETAQSDLAAERVKSSDLKDEVKTVQNQFADKEAAVMELRCEIESSKQNTARQNALIQSLRQRVREAEDAVDEKENVASRGDVTIAALRKELQSTQDKLNHVETSLRHHLGVEEEVSSKSRMWENKYSELCSQLRDLLCLDRSDVPHGSHETLVSVVSEMHHERMNLKGQVASLTQNLHENNLESKASRETIMRLVADVGREQKVASAGKETVQEIIRERDSFEQKLREREIECDKLRTQLSSSQDAWSDVKQSLDDREAKLRSLQNSLQTSEYTGQTVQSQLQQFRRHLCHLLSDVDSSVNENDEDVINRIKVIATECREHKMKVESLNNQVKNLTEEIDSQRCLYLTTHKRAKEAEGAVQEITEKYTALEGELLSADVERDKLKEDRRKYITFCEKLAQVMKLDEIASDAGFDVNGEALIARATQLVKLEGEAINDRSTTIYNLQRKVKYGKQQLESKELHLGLLRKKVSGLEEVLHGKTKIENERDDATFKYKKLIKQNEKLQRELLEYKQHVVALKAKLFETGDLKAQAVQQYHTIEELEQAVNKLAKSKEKTVKALKEVKQELETTESSAKCEHGKTESTLSQVMSELDTTKQALNETRSREKQLLDFRHVLARLLGLEVQSLSVPDYEIIARLERLVQAHHAHSITTHSLETSLHDMEKGFRAGYDDAVTILRSPRPNGVATL